MHGKPRPGGVLAQSHDGDACCFCPECVLIFPERIQSHSAHSTSFALNSGYFRSHSQVFAYVKNGIQLHSKITFEHMTTSSHSACIHTNQFRCIQMHSVRAAFGRYFIRHHSMPTSFTIGHDPHSQTASYSPDLIQSHTTSFRVDTFTLNHIRRPVTVHLQHFPHSLRASYNSASIHQHLVRIRK